MTGVYRTHEDEVRLDVHKLEGQEEPVLYWNSSDGSRCFFCEDERETKVRFHFAQITSCLLIVRTYFSRRVDCIANFSWMQTGIG